MSLLNVGKKRAKKLVSPLYFRYRSLRADVEHQRTPQPSEETVDSAPDHLLCIVVDALRPDYVPDLPLSFSSAIAPSTWTFPSVTSLHTGKYPHEHGAVAHTRPEDTSFAMPEQATPDRTLPGVMEGAGYNTFGAFAFPTPFVACKSWYQKHRVWPDAGAETVVQRYERWRRTRDRTFGYLHFGDLHAPLNPPSKHVQQYDLDWSLGDLRNIVEYTDSYDGSEACRRYREHRLRLYSAALSYLEDQLRPLVNQISDDTVIVLVGDHGEGHWEQYQHDRRFTDSRPNYGVGHGGTPFDMVARVPLGVSTPDMSDLSPEGGWASLIDVPKTFASRVVETSEFGGYDWASETIPEERVALTEGVRYGSERKSAYSDDQKIIHSREDGVTLQATVSRDQPGETLQVVQSEERPALVERLPDSWEYIGTSAETSPMVEDQLQALGYK